MSSISREMEQSPELLPSNLSWRDGSPINNRSSSWIACWPVLIVSPKSLHGIGNHTEAPRLKWNRKCWQMCVNSFQLSYSSQLFVWMTSSFKVVSRFEPGGVSACSRMVDSRSGFEFQINPISSYSPDSRVGYMHRALVAYNLQLFHACM